MAQSEDEPRYEMIIYWSDEDDAFIAEVPELPGCAADGRSAGAPSSSAEGPALVRLTKGSGTPSPRTRGRMTSGCLRSTVASSTRASTISRQTRRRVARGLRFGLVSFGAAPSRCQARRAVATT